MNYWFMPKHGWILKSLSLIKEVWHRSPHMVWLYLYWMSKTGKSVEKVVISRGWGEREIGNNCLTGTGFIWGVRKTSGIRYWYICTTLSKYYKPLTVHFKRWILWYVNFFSIIKSTSIFGFKICLISSL